MWNPQSKKNRLEKLPYRKTYFSSDDNFCIRITKNAILAVKVEQ